MVFLARLYRLAKLSASCLWAATPSNCGKPLKSSLPSQRPKGVGGQVNCLGYGHNVKNVTMGNPHPSSYGASTEKVQRLDGGGWSSTIYFKTSLQNTAGESCSVWGSAFPSFSSVASCWNCAKRWLLVSRSGAKFEG
jgi:hypothetical protein